MPELIDQPHGGALVPPGRGSGVPASGIPAGGPAANGKSWRALRSEARRIMAGPFPANLRKLQEHIDGTDQRASLVALKMYFDLFVGTPNAPGLGQDGESGGLDLSHLSEAERAQAAEALALLQRLTAKATQPDGETS